MLAGFLALGIDLGSPGRMVAASWVTLTGIGIAVALPSAPGFLGVYHSACRLVLERFGISAELALALGTLLQPSSGSPSRVWAWPWRAVATPRSANWTKLRAAEAPGQR